MSRPRLSDRRLLQVVDDAMSEAARRAGSWLACRPGCNECCHGPFPVNRLDARRLREGMAALAATDPERAQEAGSRARRQLPTLREDFPGDAATGVLADDGEGSDPYFTRHGALPCPALDPATGRCDLYAWRPLTCRTFGPPVRIGESALPPAASASRAPPPRRSRLAGSSPIPTAWRTASSPRSARRRR